LSKVNFLNKRRRKLRETEQYGFTWKRAVKMDGDEDVDASAGVDTDQ